MADPQVQEFHDRLKRVDSIHRRGGGFEAHGTLGRSQSGNASRRKSLLRPVLLVVASFMMLKAALLMQIGVIDYQERVERLSQGSQVEVVGAWVLQLDPATILIADTLKDLFKSPL